MLPWLPPLLWGAAGTALAFGIFGRAWLRAALESEGKPSTRLVLAAVVVFCLCMDAAGRLTDAARAGWLGFAEILLALGTVKVVASRFSPKPLTDPTEQPDKQQEGEAPA